MVLPLARSSAVEHYLDTVGVGGSRPPAPTKKRPRMRPPSRTPIGRSRAAEKVRRAGRGPAEALQWSAGDDTAPCPAGRKVRDRPRQPKRGRECGLLRVPQSGGLGPPRKSGGQAGARRRRSSGAPETTRPRAQPDARFETARANQKEAANAASFAYPNRAVSGRRESPAGRQGPGGGAPVERRRRHGPVPSRTQGSRPPAPTKKRPRMRPPSRTPIG